MKVKAFGTRGSHSVSGKDTIIYGGDTTCFTFWNETPEGIDRLIIDAGNGIIRLGREIIGNYFAGKEKLNIKIGFTHLHPDHSQGFPFFAPNYFEDCEILILGMVALSKNVGQVLKDSMLPPSFPIEYKDLKSKRNHAVLKNGSSFKSPLNTMRVDVMQSYAPSHPQQGSLYFKITDIASNTIVVCAWDLESKTGGDKALVNFAKGCHVMIHDTQYTTEEYNSSKMVVQGFGHSTYDMALENACQSGAKKLICTHYNPTHTDIFLTEVEKEYWNKGKSVGVDVELAKQDQIWEFI
jgi:ribonuclease BN (tRNA processing enzyme)